MDLKSLKSKLADKMRSAFARASGKPSKLSVSSNNDGSVLRFAFSDPTNVLFPGDKDSGDGPAALPLSMLLERSAHNIVTHARDLRDRTNVLVESISARAGGEVTLATQSLRFIIGGVWLLTAIWLYLSGAGTLSGSVSAISSGMSAEDAMTLARTFFPIGIAGIGVAMAVAALVAATGNGANDKVRQEAHDLGLFIAETAREFDNDLTHMREEMNRRGDPADAVVDLSHAHLTALEATAYFREISFLTGTEGEDAKLRFRRFLSRPSSGGSMLEGFILGALIGVIAAVFFTGPKPELPVVSALPDIAKYPWAANLLLLGGILYATIGVILSVAGGAISAGAVSKARDEALASLRGAFTSREAPRPADVIRRIEDAVDVFRARVGERGTGTSRSAHGGPAAASFDQGGEGDDIPAWRKRDSSAQFVETSFHSAPQTWRADAYAKKFEATGIEETGSKRGLLGLKKDKRD